CATARSADSAGVYDPAIEERGDPSEKFLSLVDQPLVKFVDVKKPPDKIDMERLALAVAIKPDCDARAQNQCDECERGDRENSFLFVWYDEETLRDGFQSGDKCE